MSLVKPRTVAIVPFRDGLATAPFKAALPKGRSVTVGRMQMRLPDHQAVTLVARDRNLSFSAYAYVDGRENPANAMADGELKIYVQGKNARAIISRFLPVFRVNSGPIGFEPNLYPWFEPQAQLDEIAAKVAGLIQDVALLGRDAAWVGVLELLYRLRGPKTHLEPLGHEVDKLHHLFTERVGPKYGEVSELVLGFAHALSTRTIYSGQSKASLEEVYAAATAALGYFDVRTVARTFVVGALAAAAHLDGKKDRRASEYNQRLQGVLKPSLAFSNRAEGLEKLAEDIHSVPRLSFLSASMLLLAGCEYLESAFGYRYMGLKSHCVGAARSVFRLAHSRMDTFAGEMLTVDDMRWVFMEFLERQLKMIG